MILTVSLNVPVKLKLDNNINAISIVANVQVLYLKKSVVFELHLAFEPPIVDDNHHL
jgi:hypothetical protein